MSESEVSITKDGVTLKGGPADDVRPLIRRAATAPDSLLRVFNNIVSLPLDYMSNNLERFRAKFADRFDEIPLERRQQPPMRIGCAVLQQVAFTADEPDIQDLFANLLASASDCETVAHVHPGFASVVSELRAVEAQMLAAVARGSARNRQFDVSHFRIDGVEQAEVSKSISNLVRLGLFDWQPRNFSEHELRKFAGADSISVAQIRDVNGLQREIEKEVSRLKLELMKQFQWQLQRHALRVTTFGEAFMVTVIDRGEPDARA